MKTLTGARPIVIAHRGASAERPEHTLAAYALAIEQGADFIEPDIVATADGALIARHENALAVLDAGGRPDHGHTTTDVPLKAEFASRLCTKVIDGRTVRGWFSEDFTLAEIRSLRAVERLPALRPANTAWDGRFGIPTLEEIVTLAREAGARLGRPIGIYPETKHPSWFQHEGRRLDGGPIGFDLTARLLAELVRLEFTDPARVFLQSFETDNLRTLATRLMPAAGVRLPLIQLIEAQGAPRDLQLAGDARDYAALCQPAGLADIARYAAGIGVQKSLLFTAEGRPTSLPADAHAAGLLVHAWTLRPENHFLPERHRRGTEPAAHGALEEELREHCAAGIDGVFIDSPRVASALLATLSRD